MNMITQESRELLFNAMGSSFAETEIEAQIAEATGISREEYNTFIENDLELPECIMKYREVSQKRKLYEEKIINTEPCVQFPLNCEKQNVCPPAIQSMLVAGMLKDVKNEDGKYFVNNGHNDKSIIAWIFNYSGYDDEITSEIYYKHVYTDNKASTIDRYFSEARNEARNN